VFFFIAAGSFLFLWRENAPSSPQDIARFGRLSFADVCPSRSEKSSAKPRARDLGVPFDGTPGPLNAITDVSGVTVGHTTLISAKESFRSAKAQCRTGVTAVLPRGKDSMNNPVLQAGGRLTATGK